MVCVHACFAYSLLILSMYRNKIEFFSETFSIIQNKKVDRKLVQAPCNFIAGRPKAALLFWSFGDFRCGVPLFIVILVTCIYNYKNR